MYRSYIKRVIDTILALIGLIVLSPLLLILTLWLHFANKGAGVFFIQERPGKEEKIFKLYKFKSMTDRRDEEGNLLPDRERITPIGNFIRKTSLDELPQLWNVLCGSMSLVGPRPLLKEYLPLYTLQQARRHEVRPGITGWAQVYGRNSISWKQKFDLDIWYIEHLSFRLDCLVIWRTISKVLKREGINSSSCDTMEPFKGNKK
ncbi:MAG: sugar transferase [Porphyromonas endodontalis]|uniref:sugar transferase n=1 Tax=Porphyromonas endodontalis TaxID=28124 RepID=UPI003621B664